MAKPTTRQPHAQLLYNRAFLLLWGAYGISALGDHISEMAILKSMDAMTATNITQLQAMMTFMFMFPFFLLGPLNGILADRLPRRGIMVVADVVRMTLMLNFSLLLGWLRPHGDFAAFTPLLIVGIFAALFSPARLALLPTLIRENQILRANALTSGLGVIATMIAAYAGGKLAQHFHPKVAFTIDAATFLASAILLLCIRMPAREKQRQISRRRVGGGRALTEAFSYALSHRRVLQLIGIAVVVWSCGSVVRSTIPALVRDIYGRHDYGDIGAFQAFLGIGILAGSLILSGLGNALRSEIAITWSLGGIATAIAVLALSAFLPLSPNAAHHLGAAAIIIAGACSAGVMASYNSLMQRIIPNRMRGRVFGLTDLASVAGLLAATGLLGIPQWPNIDRWIGWLLLAVAAVVLATALISLFVRLKSSRFGMTRAFWFNLNEFYCKWWFRLHREGICTIPERGPVIIIANHTCAIDPLLLIASTPNRILGFLVAEEFIDIPICGRLMRMVGCIPVKRDGQDATGTRAALRRLKSGEALGVFIEGRIPPPGEQVAPKDGAAMLALHSNALIVPAYISGTRYDENITRSFFRRHRARVRFGPPIDLSRYWIPKADKEALNRISNQLLNRIHELGEAE